MLVFASGLFLAMPQCTYNGRRVSSAGRFNRTRNMSTGSNPSEDKKMSSNFSGKRAASSKKRAPSATELNSFTAFSAVNENSIDIDEELKDQLKLSLVEVSRQRLRALLISMRRIGINTENRLTAKDLWSVFNDQNIKISGRIFQLMLKKYEDQFGIDYEKLWKFMVETQKYTGRDSVLATCHMDDETAGPQDSFQDIEDLELIKKLHKSMASNVREYYLDELRSSCQERDKGRTGQIEKKLMLKLCQETNLPLYGHLLNKLLSRCDDEKNGQISWPELLTLLERAQNYDVNQTQQAKEMESDKLHHKNMLKKTHSSSSLPLIEPVIPINNQPNEKKEGKSEKLEAVPESKGTLNTVIRQSATAGSIQPLSAPTPKIVPPVTIKLSDGKKKEGKEIKGSTADNADLTALVGTGTAVTTNSSTKNNGKTVTASANGEAKKTHLESSEVKKPAEVAKTPGQMPKAQDGKQTKAITNAGDNKKNDSTIKQNPKPLKRSKTSESLKASNEKNAQISKQPASKEKPADNMKDNKQKKAIEDKGHPSKQPLKKNKSITSLGLAESPREEKNNKISTDITTPSDAKKEEKKDSHPKKSQPLQELPPGSKEFAKTSEKSSEIGQTTKTTSEKKEEPSSSTPPASNTTNGNSEAAKKSKGSGSLLSSMKNFFSGKKEDIEPEATTAPSKEVPKKEKHEMVPIVTVNPPEYTEMEELPEVIDEAKSVGASVSSDKYSVEIRGQTIIYDVPDKYSGKAPNTKALGQQLELDWVYGYRGNDCRHNMYMAATGELVYFITSVVVLFHAKAYRQRHYREHTGEVKSISLHTNKVTVATGQALGTSGSDHDQPHVRVWQADTLQTLHIIGDGLIEKSVTCLAFSSSENWLVMIDTGEGHTMRVWDLKDKKEVAKVKAGKDIICQVGFHPKNNKILVTIGKEHQIWWNLNILQSPHTIDVYMKPNFEDKWMKAKFVICMMFKPNGDLITGDSNGTIYVWPDGTNTISQAIKHAHDGPVFYLGMVNNFMVTAGRDGGILAWTGQKNLEQAASIQLQKTEGGIRMLQHDEDTLYIGTTFNSILTAEMGTTGPPLKGSSSLAKTPLTTCHFDEIGDLGCSLNSGRFLSGGSDGMLALFDANKHQLVWKCQVKNANIMSVDLHPDGKHLAIGTRDAIVGNGLSVQAIVSENGLKEIFRVKIAKEKTTCVKFSPDGKLLAAGCYDSSICILRFLDELKKFEILGKCKGHKSPITSLDWSKNKLGDSYILQSSSMGYEYHLWNASSCEILDNTAEARNLEWNTQNCLFGYTVANVWGSDPDGPTVKSVDMLRKKEVVASGNDYGEVNLYRMPCNSKKMGCRVYQGHCGEVAGLRFVSNEFLVTAGEKDCAILQWKMK